MTSLSFWGAAGTVTGSKYLIEADRARVLIDCGLFQGMRELRERNWQEPPFKAAAVDAVIITHAHIDHTGYLPRFVRQGFRGAVFCSRGTADLLKILLPDSARLQEEEADYRNRHMITRHAPALPLYTEQDAREALKLLQVVKNTGQAFPAATDADDFEAQFGGFVHDGLDDGVEAGNVAAPGENADAADSGHVRDLSRRSNSL